MSVEEIPVPVPAPVPAPVPTSAPLLGDKPPEWLVDVIRKHRPVASVFGGGDLMCAGHQNDLDKPSYMPWTPEHLARMIHQKLSNTVAQLMEGTV